MKEKNKEQPLAMHVSPRCGARCKRTGLPCRAPAMKNARCRLHGGKSPGPPVGNQNSFKHGLYTSESLAQRKYISKIIRESRNLIKEIRLESKKN